MKSVAEGVEDIADWNLMRALVCTLAQSYFIARPMAAQDTNTWCLIWQQRRAALIAPLPSHQVARIDHREPKLLLAS